MMPSSPFRRAITFAGSHSHIRLGYLDLNRAPFAVARAIARTVGDCVLMAQLFGDSAERVFQLKSTGRVYVAAAALFSEVLQNRCSYNIARRPLRRQIHTVDRRSGERHVIESLVGAGTTGVFAAI